MGRNRLNAATRPGVGPNAPRAFQMVIDSGHQWTADAWNAVKTWLDQARQSPNQNVRNAAQLLADAIGPNPPAFGSLLTEERTNCCA
jgi:hypothetical protein